MKGDSDRPVFTSQSGSLNELHSLYYDATAAGLKRELNTMESSIKSWQEEFKQKHGRKPTLEDMRNDPEIGAIVSQLRGQKASISDAIRRHRFH
mgnify:CR=1 FL=1